MSKDLVKASDLQDLDDIRRHLHMLAEEERRKDEELRALLMRNGEIDAKMASLQRVAPRLQRVHADARELCEMVGTTCALAENVSSKVRELDLAKGRLYDTIQRVGDILDLRSCLDGVQSALNMKQYEKACGYVHRYLSFEPSLLAGDVASDDTGEHVSPLAVFRSAQRELATVVNDKFDEAVGAEDTENIERFFKLFALINLHEDGIAKYSRYLCARIAKHADENLRRTYGAESQDGPRISFVDIITSLYEFIAKTIESQQTIVETYFGPGFMTKVIGNIQRECDVQAGKVLHQFFDKRTFTQRLDLIRSSYGPDATPMDPRELDNVLFETGGLMGRTSLYFRFLHKHITADVAAWATNNDKERKIVIDEQAAETIIRRCELNKEVQVLSGHYIAMEEYLLRNTVAKAISMEERDPGAITSTLVDDVFFVLKKSSRRSFLTANPDCFCALLNHLSTILLGDYLRGFEAHVAQGHKGRLDFSVLQGKLQAGLSTITQQQGKDPNEQRDNYLVMLNNIELTTDFIERMHKDLVTESGKVFAQASPSDQAKLESCLSEFLCTSQTFSKLLKDGMRNMCKSLVAPRVKSLADTFLQATYEVTEELLAGYDGTSPLMTAFMQGIYDLTQGFKGMLLANNLDMFVGIVAEEVTHNLERVVFQLKFTSLGAVQFDKDMRALIAQLTAASQWPVRDKFSKLTQIASLLNVDNVNDAVEYWGSAAAGKMAWRLTPIEVRRVLGLRVEFKSDEINRLKLS